MKASDWARLTAGYASEEVGLHERRQSGLAMIRVDDEHSAAKREGDGHHDERRVLVSFELPGYPAREHEDDHGDERQHAARHGSVYSERRRLDRRARIGEEIIARLPGGLRLRLALWKRLALRLWLALWLGLGRRHRQGSRQSKACPRTLR